MKELIDHSASAKVTSRFMAKGGELWLSNIAQRELLSGISERGASMRTTVRGFSMFPFIRDLDVVIISPMNGRPPVVGDVVAFTRPENGRLTIHRVIANLGTGWLVKGDNCDEADGVVTQDHILGKVIAVERNGRNVRLGLGAESVWVAALNRGHSLNRLQRLFRLPRRTAAFALRKLQTLSVYRGLARSLAKPVSISIARHEDMETVQQRLNPSGPYRLQPPNPNVTNWVAKKGLKIVGFVQLVFHPESHFPWVGHWLFSLHVWGLYRGMGIGEALTRRVIEKAAERNGSELFLLVFQDNDRAIRLYRKLGFAPFTIPSLEPMLASEKQKLGRRRIVLRRPIM